MTDAPTLFPTIEADDGTIRSDLEHHGCAYVVELEGKRWLVHPNMLTVYGRPKLYIPESISQSASTPEPRSS
jgi:hypothetical protein